MSEEQQKSYGFNKKTTKVAIVAFRLGKAHKEKLDALLLAFNVHPRKDRMSDRMNMLIDKVDDALKRSLATYFSCLQKRDDLKSLRKVLCNI